MRPATIALVLLVLLAGGCGDDDDAAADPTPDALAPDDTVLLTVYLRAGEGSSATLTPVEREVVVDANLPEEAVRLLLEGPLDDEGELRPALPPTAELLDLDIGGGTAAVTLSAEVLEDAEGTVGAAHEHELLALAALANTLTQFPSVDEVHLHVADVDDDLVTRFWGGWGLPERLVRDDAVVDDPDGDGLPDLDRFSRTQQRVGESTDVAVRPVDLRVRERIGIVRHIIELAEPDGGETPPVPPARASRDGDDVVLEVSVDHADELEVRGDDIEPAPWLEADAGHLRLVIPGAADRPFHLHTLSNPTRVVLDVKTPKPADSRPKQTR